MPPKRRRRTKKPRKRSFDVEFKLRAVAYAKKWSRRRAARRFEVDPRRIREWITQEGELENLKKKRFAGRKRLKGGGSKKVSEELERVVCTWVIDQRRRGLYVSRKMIGKKAREVFYTVIDEASKGREDFVASPGWVDNFIRRNRLRLRETKPVAVEEPGLVEKLVSYVVWVSNYRATNDIRDSDIIAMDETSVWFDTQDHVDVRPTGSECVSAETGSHERHGFTVALAAKGDGTKLKPLIVFPRGIRKVNALKDTQRAVVDYSRNGRTNDRLTVTWLRKVCGRVGLGKRKRLLAWDEHRCHLSAATRQELSWYNMECAFVPGGCTKYIQAANVVWSKQFESRLRACYDEWASDNDNRQSPSDADVEAPSMCLMVTWILSAWDDVPNELIAESFKSCALTVATDGSEDHLIHCFKEHEECAEGRAKLAVCRQKKLDLASPDVDDEDSVEWIKNEVIVSDSDEEEED